jgi:hypothetical protein
MSSSVNKSPPKSEPRQDRDPTKIKAWQVGHEVNQSAYRIFQEYRDDSLLSPWCDSVAESLRNSVVQVMEAYYKYGSDAKLKRYEASLFYIHQAQYTLLLAQDLGLWQVGKLMTSVKQYGEIVRATSFHFIDKKPKTV